MADRDDIERNVWNDPILDDPDRWEDTTPTWEHDEEGFDALADDDAPTTWEPPEPTADHIGSAPTPPQRIRKRRIVCGVFFLVLGLIGVLSDAFELDAEVAVTVASLVGAITLLGGLVAAERRRRQIVQLS